MGTLRPVMPITLRQVLRLLANGSQSAVPADSSIKRILAVERFDEASFSLLSFEPQHDHAGGYHEYAQPLPEGGTFVQENEGEDRHQHQAEFVHRRDF